MRWNAASLRAVRHPSLINYKNMAKLKKFKNTAEQIERGVVKLKLPVKIRETVGKDGYVITDSNDIQHFFYQNGKDNFLDYDGFCSGVN